MPLRNALRAIPMRFAMHLRGKSHQAGVEDARIHLPEPARNQGPETHMRNDIAFGVEAGCDLYQLQPFCADLEYCTLRDEKRHLPALARHAGAVADLLQLRDKLLMAAFLANDGLALLPGNIEIAGR